MDLLKWTLTACFVLAMMVLGLKAEPKKDAPEQTDNQTILSINFFSY